MAHTKDVARLHAEFLAKRLRNRVFVLILNPGLGAQGFELFAGMLSGQAHGMAHVKHRSRTQRAHIKRRDIGVSLGNPNALTRGTQHLRNQLCHRGVGTLAHIDGVAKKNRTTIG